MLWHSLQSLDEVLNLTQCTVRNVSPGLQGSNFTDNHAPTSQGLGGALSVTDNSTAQVTNCTFNSNRAERGAAIYAANSSLIVADSNFTANTARSAGDAPTWAPNLPALSPSTSWACSLPALPTSTSVAFHQPTLHRHATCLPPASGGLQPTFQIAVRVVDVSIVRRPRTLASS